MKKIETVEVTPVFVEVITEKLEENKIYISKMYGTAIHNCLCGCGNLTVTPLGPDGWILTEHPDGKISFHPSIGNYQFPCKSHYVITKNKANFL